MERRTYGAMSLASNTGTFTATPTIDQKNNYNGSTLNTSGHVVSSGTISIWEGLIKQTRVALLLQSRKGADSGTTRRLVISMRNVPYCL